MSETIKQRVNNLEDELTSVKQKNKTKIVENHSEIEKLQQEIDGIQTQLTEIQSEVTDSESVDPEIEEFQQKLTLLAHNIIQMRSTLDEIITSVTRVQDKVNIQFKIIQKDISSLACNACENTVEMTELETLDCPHCNRQFTELEVTTRFLRSNIGTLHTNQ